MSAQKLMLDDVEIEHVIEGDVHRYAFRGQLAHTFSYTDVPEPRRRFLLIDLSGITLVSSVGIREWVILIKLWSEKYKIIYEKCSICFVDQINMVPDCLGAAKMRSCYAPFFCSACDAEKICLIDIASHKLALMQQEIPTFYCDCCNAAPLEFDALEESYFSFMHFK